MRVFRISTTETTDYRNDNGRRDSLILLLL